MIRHGETDFNKDKRYQGNLDIPLSKDGMKYLKKADFDPERVYISTLIRTRQTADIMFPDAQKIPVDDIKEMNFGDFEGKNAQEMKDDKDYRNWVDNDCEPRCPHGEDRAGFIKRVSRGFEGIIEKERREGAKRVVIVVHGGTIMTTMEKYALPRRTYFDWLPGNGEGYLLELKENDDITNCHFIKEVAYHIEDAPKNIHEI
ncbi:MAG: histidine phosphatase family protein [Lachnospiraceae bacterium]|nr:histidine phosphatase family protein [Lachnospiraceae bacterium]